MATHDLSKDRTGFFGVDVAKEHLDVAQANGQAIETLANQEVEIAGWIKRLQGQEVHRIVVEATGGYEAKLVAQLAAAKLPVVVVNPRQVRIVSTPASWPASRPTFAPKSGPFPPKTSAIWPS